MSTRICSDELGGYTVPEGRTKPWGTAHAVLSASSAIDSPFAVINADDFYGREAFDKAVSFLKNQCDEKTWSIIGYDLSKTLSENGTVSRGVCQVNDQQELISIAERTKIYPENGRIFYEEEDGKHELPGDAKVSMNFWCIHQSAFSEIRRLFHEFLKENIDKPKAEFFIPLLGQHFLDNGGTIKVIPTSAKWFGVTYKEDAPGVQQSIDELVIEGKYPAELWK